MARASRRKRRRESDCVWGWCRAAMSCSAQGTTVTMRTMELRLRGYDETDDASGRDLDGSKERETKNEMRCTAVVCDAMGVCDRAANAPLPPFEGGEQTRGEGARAGDGSGLGHTPLEPKVRQRYQREHSHDVIQGQRNPLKCTVSWLCLSTGLWTHPVAAHVTCEPSTGQDHRIDVLYRKTEALPERVWLWYRVYCTSDACSPTWPVPVAVPHCLT